METIFLEKSKERLDVLLRGCKAKMDELPSIVQAEYLKMFNMIKAVPRL
jgi:hypothetical protein